MKNCKSLDEVRSQIDEIDEELSNLLSERAGYVAQAARFKSPKNVRDQKRIEEIISKARAIAKERGADADLIEEIYRGMIESFIKYQTRFLK